MEHWELVTLPVEVSLQATELSREALTVYSGGKDDAKGWGKMVKEPWAELEGGSERGRTF